jgi:hypothetical protein
MYLHMQLVIGIQMDDNVQAYHIYIVCTICHMQLMCIIYFMQLEQKLVARVIEN